MGKTLVEVYKEVGVKDPATIIKELSDVFGDSDYDKVWIEALCCPEILKAADDKFIANAARWADNDSEISEENLRQIAEMIGVERLIGCMLHPYFGLYYDSFSKYVSWFLKKEVEINLRDLIRETVYLGNNLEIGYSDHIRAALLQYLDVAKAHGVLINAVELEQWFKEVAQKADFGEVQAHGWGRILALCQHKLEG